MFPEWGKRMRIRSVCLPITSKIGNRVQDASDAGVPGVACLTSRRATAFTKLFQVVCDRQAIDEFNVLVADLPGKPHAKRSTVGYGKIAAVHAVTEKCLRMQSVGHVDTVPSIRFRRDIHDVLGLW